MFLLHGRTRQAAHGQNARVGQCQGSVPFPFPPFGYLRVQRHGALRWGCYFVVSRTRGTCQKGVVWPPRFRGRTIFQEIRNLLSVTCIVSGLLCPPRSEVRRPRNSTLGKHLLFPQMKTFPQQHSLRLEWVSYECCSYPLAYEVVINIHHVCFQKKLVIERLEAFAPFNAGEITRGIDATHARGKVSRALRMM